MRQPVLEKLAQALGGEKVNIAGRIQRRGSLFAGKNSLAIKTGLGGSAIGGAIGATKEILANRKAKKEAGPDGTYKKKSVLRGAARGAALGGALGTAAAIPQQMSLRNDSQELKAEKAKSHGINVVRKRFRQERASQKLNEQKTTRGWSHRAAAAAQRKSKARNKSRGRG